VRWKVRYTLLAGLLLSSCFAAATDYRFQCSDRLDRFTCERRVSMLRHIIERQGSAMPVGWTWLLVADSDWPLLKERYRLRNDFAFTHVGERRTVVNALLFERFERSTWEWAVAHETAHVVCDLVNEGTTDRVAIGLARRRPLDLQTACPSTRTVAAD
jgi:hypothetical protein